MAQALTFTPRQAEILKLLADGLLDKEIAHAELGVSTRTVNSIVRQILKRTGARNRTHAVVLAIRAGALRFE